MLTVTVSPFGNGEVEAVFGLMVTIITVGGASYATMAAYNGDAHLAPDLRGGRGRGGRR